MYHLNKQVQTIHPIFHWLKKMNDWIMYNEILYRPVTQEEYAKAVQFLLEENKRLTIENEMIRKECHQIKEAIRGDDNLAKLEKSAR